MANFIVFHIMRDFHVVVDDAATRRAESFNGIEFVLLHASSLSASHYRHRLAGMDS